MNKGSIIIAWFLIHEQPCYRRDDSNVNKVGLLVRLNERGFLHLSSPRTATKRLQGLYKVAYYDTWVAVSSFQPKLLWMKIHPWNH